MLNIKVCCSHPVIGSVRMGLATLRGQSSNSLPIGADLLEYYPSLRAQAAQAKV